MRYLALLAFLAFPAMAYTPQELLGERDVAIDCKEGKCTVSQADMEWIVARDRLLNGLLEKTAIQMRQCGVKGI